MSLRWGRAGVALALVLILIVAAALRWTGLAWDHGYLFHPDERQILLVVSRLGSPSSISEFFSPDSPLNPKFFAYGSLPLYILRLLAPLAPPTTLLGPWDDRSLSGIAYFARALSGLFDLGTLLVTFALGKRAYDSRVGLIAAACVAVTVLHIQLSHFYAVDTLLALLTVATLYAAFRVAENATRTANRNWLLASGVLFGLALATKITAFVLVVPLLLAIWRAYAGGGRSLRAVLGVLWRPLALTLGVALAAFVITQPYALLDWYSYGRDVIRELWVARGWLDYPYTRQYIGTLPVAYQVTQGAIWAMGLPLGIWTWGGALLMVGQWWRGRDWRDAFLLSFAVVYFAAIAFQYAKYLRYLLPLLPVLYIVAACAWLRVFGTRRTLAVAVTAFVLVSAFLYSAAYVRLYEREHPWLTASRWLYENVDKGEVLLIEEWDDALPTMIRFPDGERYSGEYEQIALPLYSEDSPEKRATIIDALERADVIVVASQRAYGSVGRLVERYPSTVRYYDAIFGGDLGFEPVMTTRNDPELFGVTIRDDPRTATAKSNTEVEALLERKGAVWNWGFADESFSVYDHPQPIIFQKVRSLTQEQLEQILQ